MQPTTPMGTVGSSTQRSGGGQTPSRDSRRRRPRRVPDPLARLDAALERFTGVDLRLLYGLSVPVIVVCGLIIVIALTPSYPLVGAVVVVEIAALALIVVKLVAMLSDRND